MGLGFGNVAHHSGGAHGKDQLALVVAVWLAQDGIALESFCCLTKVVVGLSEGGLMALDALLTLDLEELLSSFNDAPGIPTLHLND